MNKLVVGDKDCTSRDILKILGEDAHLSLLQNGWTSLARGLGTTRVKTQNLQQDLLLSKKGIFDVVEAILEDWKSRSGKLATLAKLLDIIENECSWTHMAECLYEKYRAKIPNGTTWTDLDDKTKFIILQRQVEFLDETKPLEVILNKIEPGEQDDFLKRTMSASSIRQLMGDENVVLTPKSYKQKNSFYVSRTLSNRRRINPDIFRQQSRDIFVIDGITFLDLETIVGDENMHLIARSSKQLYSVTVRFIMLLHQEDYSQIIKAANLKNVHLIKHERGRFYWVKTSGGIQLLQDYILADQQHYSEAEFLVNIQQDKLPVCLADKAGTGKSVLFKKLYKLVKSKYPNRITLLVSFSKPLTCDHTESNVICLNDVIDWITNRVTDDPLGRKLLGKLLENENQEVELFLDGFDEVAVDELPIATKMLQHISSEFKHFRIYVATRPTHRIYLEQALRVLSYNIVPLSPNDQIWFLKEHWVHHFGISCHPNHEKLANTLLSSMSSLKMDDSELVGIPILCAMLAEIYKDEAQKYSKIRTNEYIEPIVNINSIHDMYKGLMNQRFKNVDEKRRRHVERVHQLVSMYVIFPNVADDFKAAFEIDSLQSVNWDEINRLGVLWTTKTKEFPHTKLSFRFTHKTYAEYLLAQFVVENLVTLFFSSRKSSSGNTFIDIFVREFLNCDTLLVNRDCYGIGIWTEIEKCSEIPKCRRLWKELAMGLHLSFEDIAVIEKQINFFTKIESNNTYEYNQNEVLWVLLEWSKKCRPVADVIEAFQILELSSLAETVKKAFCQKNFTQSTLCFFVSNCLTELSSVDIRLCSRILALSKHACWQGVVPSLHLFYILQASVNQNYIGLFRLVALCCTRAKKKEFFRAEKCRWPTLIFSAAKNSQFNLLVECCKFVTNMTGTTLSKMNYKDIWSIPFWDCTPVHAACARGDLDIFRYLYREMDSRAQKLEGLLHLCVQGSTWNSEETIVDKIEIVSFLVGKNAGCLEDKRPTFNETPLLMSAIHIKLLQHLIELEADTSAVTLPYGDNVAHGVPYGLKPDEYHTFVELLCRKRRTDIFLAQNIAGYTPLHHALYHIDVQIDTLKLLAGSLGTNFNTPDSKGRLIWNGVLHAAVICGNVEAVDFFISKGCNINQVCKTRTPLHAAVTMGRKNVNQVVKMLLQNKADVSVVDQEGKSALWYVDNDDDVSSKLKPSTIKLIRESASRYERAKGIFTSVFNF